MGNPPPPNQYQIITFCNLHFVSHNGVILHLWRNIYATWRTLFFDRWSSKVPRILHCSLCTIQKETIESGDCISISFGNQCQKDSPIVFTKYTRKSDIFFITMGWDILIKKPRNAKRVDVGAIARVPSIRESQGGIYFSGKSGNLFRFLEFRENLFWFGSKIVWFYMFGIKICISKIKFPSPHFCSIATFGRPSLGFPMSNLTPCSFPSQNEQT